MSVDISEEDFKLARDEIYLHLLQLQTNFADLEEMLKKLETEKETNLYYMFDEFQRHGQEFIDYFTDEKIEELYEKK